MKQWILTTALSLSMIAFATASAFAYTPLEPAKDLTMDAALVAHPCGNAAEFCAACAKSCSGTSTCVFRERDCACECDPDSINAVDALA